MKNLDTVFPFYDALIEQFRYKNDCDIQNIPFIIVSDDKLVPWIIRRTHSHGTVNDIELYFCATDGSATYPLHGTDASLTLFTDDDGSHEYILYTGATLPAPLPKLAMGYYLKVHDTFSNKYWYSEVFVVRTSAELAAYSSLVFSSTKMISLIRESFEQKIYLTTEWKAPEYIREDIGEKRNGLTVYEKQIKIKVDLLRLYQVPEYIIDALILLPLFETVEYTDVNASAYTFDEIRIKDPEWLAESYGNLAKLEIQLLHNIVIK